MKQLIDDDSRESMVSYARMLNALFRRNATDDARKFENFVIKFARQFVEGRKKLPILFRYSKADYSNIRNLEKEQLFLSPIGEMNDAFEGLAFGVNDEQENLYKNSAFIKSFSETYDNLLMWAHYADSYNGICVGYDFNRLSVDLLWHLYRVIYVEKVPFVVDAKRILNELNMLRRDLEDNAVQMEYPNIVGITSMYLVKPKEWEYEREWRILVTAPQMFGYPDEIGDENKQLYNVRERRVSVNSCVSSIYLGPKINTEIQEHISEIATKLSVPVYKMRLDSDEYKLIPEK